jgi:hypothetical protein
VLHHIFILVLYFSLVSYITSNWVKIVLLTVAPFKYFL